MDVPENVPPQPLPYYTVTNPICAYFFFFGIQLLIDKVFHWEGQQCLNNSQNHLLKWKLHSLPTGFDPYLYSNGSSSAGCTLVESRSYTLNRGMLTDILLHPWSVQCIPLHQSRCQPLSIPFWSVPVRSGPFPSDLEVEGTNETFKLRGRCFVLNKQIGTS